MKLNYKSVRDEIFYNLLNKLMDDMCGFVLGHDEYKAEREVMGTLDNSIGDIVNSIYGSIDEKSI